MKTRVISSLTFGFLLFLSSCQQEESPSPAKGSVAFSLSQLAKDNDNVIETLPPAYVVLSIKESNGNIEENIRLSLFQSGDGYITESLELLAGNHQLVEFEVFDATNKSISAAPLEGSEFARYVTDPLPMNFIIKKDGAQINPQVLAVFSDDQPREVNLDIRLQYPVLIPFDSAYIVFKNASSEIKYNLTLDNSSHVAVGRITAIPSGDWKISTSYFNTVIKNYKSLEGIGTTDISISPTSTRLISTENTVVVETTSGSANYRSFSWQEYFYYQLYLGNKVEGFARLPQDPIDPFIEISTFQSTWTYAFVSRSFYNRSSDGSSNYYQGGGAFEVYGENGDTYDRLEKRLIDTTSLKPGIVQLQDKEWNFADGLIIMYDHHGNELVLFYEWDLRTSEGG